MQLIGYNTINAGILSGSEVVSEKIQSTVDAKALASLDWSRYNMTVFGPAALDLRSAKKPARTRNIWLPARAMQTF
ncbi:MAG: hypothetical protein R2881_03255 [Eubacteriales bacterium]